MADDNKSWFMKMVSNTWEVAEFASVMSHILPKLGIKIPEFDVKKETGEFKLTSREGGENTLTDERYLQTLLGKMGANEDGSRDLEPEARITWFLGMEFTTDSPDWKTRVRALASHEEFRMVVCGMDSELTKVGSEVTTISWCEGKRPNAKKHDQKQTNDLLSMVEQEALPFLESFDDRIVTAYKMVTKHDDDADVPPVHTWTKVQQRKVHEIVSKQNRARGLPHMPTANEPHWTDHLDQILMMIKTHGYTGGLKALKKLSRANRKVRASEYLAKRKHRTKQKKRWALGRLRDRIVQTL